MEKDLVDKWLSPLENLQVVEAPAFLITRIRQAVSRKEYERVSPGKLVLAGFAFCLLLLFNVFALLQNNKPFTKTETAARSLNILPDNDLYK